MFESMNHAMQREDDARAELEHRHGRNFVMEQLRRERDDYREALERTADRPAPGVPCPETSPEDREAWCEECIAADVLARYEDTPGGWHDEPMTDTIYLVLQTEDWHGSEPVTAHTYKQDARDEARRRNDARDPLMRNSGTSYEVVAIPLDETEHRWPANPQRNYRDGIDYLQVPEETDHLT